MGCVLTTVELLVTNSGVNDVALLRSDPTTGPVTNDSCDAMPMPYVKHHGKVDRPQVLLLNLIVDLEKDIITIHPSWGYASTRLQNTMIPTSS